MSDDRAAVDVAALSYSYRPSLLGAGCSFRLTPTGIAWDIGARSGHIPYQHIRRIRMSFQPAAMQTHRFVTVVSAIDGPPLSIASTSWRSMVEQERLDAGYTAFIRELHRRVDDRAAGVVCEVGGHAVKYWAGLIMFGAAALGLAVLTARAAQAAAWGGAAVIAVFLLLFLWQAGGYFRRNRPGRYDPATPPPDLLP